MKTESTSGNSGRDAIQVFRPKFNTSAIINRLNKILDSGWVGLGPAVAEFESDISEYIGCKDVVCLNSCTSALHLAVKSLRLRAGSNVLTTPITFVSTNHVILYEKLNPIFCDVNQTTGCMDFNDAERLVRSGLISAIILVHNAGYSCDMERFNRLSEDYNIPIIEDCAHAFGARYSDGVNVGNSRNICCFSFHAVKNLACGDGGAITGNNLPVRWLKKMRWMGIDKSTAERSKKGYSWEYDVNTLGYKYHMNDIAASIGIEQLKLVDEHNGIRRSIAHRYKVEISEERATFPEYSHDYSSYHFYPIMVPDPDSLAKKLAENSVFPGMHYKRNDSYPMYRPFTRKLPGVDSYQRFEITLPIHPSMTNAEVDEIVRIINE